MSAFHQPADREVVDSLERAGVDRVILELETAGRDDALAQLEDHARAVL